MRTNTKTLVMVQLAILSALEAIIAFTPLGSIQTGGIVATLGHIPVIIAAIVLGYKAGLYMGALFGTFSFIVWTFMTPNPVFAFMFTPFYAPGNVWSLVICFVPRILLGLFTALTFIGMQKLIKNQIISASVAAAVGSLTNTVLVLGGTWIFFRDQVAGGKHLIEFIIAAAGFNGLIEMIIAIILSSALVIPLRKAIERR